MSDEFKIITASVGQIDMLEEIGRGLAHALEIIERHVPKGRELSLVVTKLQEAQLWANQGAMKK